jgi:hypothetical protein
VESLIAILRRHEDSNVRGRGRVWRIDGGTPNVDACKVEVLDEICRHSHPFVRYEEAPESGRAWMGVEIAPFTWRLHGPAPGDEVLKWLYMGNWQLYVAAGPIARIPDLIRAKDEDVETFLKENAVSLIIDSFHDDESWVVGIASGATGSRL